MAPRTATKTVPTAANGTPPIDLWADRIVRTERMGIDAMLANPDNWRIHPKEQQEDIGVSLRSFGWVRRVLYNETTGHIIDGHQRVLEADKAGQPTVPTDIVQMAPDEEAAVLAILDTITSGAVTDQGKLNSLLDRARGLLQAGPNPRLRAMMDRLRKPAPGDPAEHTRVGRTPEEKLVVFQTNAVRQFVLHFPQAEYNEMLLWLEKLRDGDETNSEVIQRTIRQAVQA